MSVSNWPIRVGSAAKAIAECDVLIALTGTGMLRDTGFPPIRKKSDFLKHYPALEKMMDYQEALDILFKDDLYFKTMDASLPWGFFGHQIAVSRHMEPHPGYEILLGWMEDRDYFAISSTFECHFLRAGLDEEHLCEIKGSMMHLQCCCNCVDDIYTMEGIDVKVEPSGLAVEKTIPVCPTCGNYMRPNVKLPKDEFFVPRRLEWQEQNFLQWCDVVRGSQVVVMEIGASIKDEDLRGTTEIIAEQLEGQIIRIHPKHYSVPDGHIGIQGTAQSILEYLDHEINVVGTG